MLIVSGPTLEKLNSAKKTGEEVTFKVNDSAFGTEDEGTPIPISVKILDIESLEGNEYYLHSVFSDGKKGKILYDPIEKEGSLPSIMEDSGLQFKLNHNTNIWGVKPSLFFCLFFYI